MRSSVQKILVVMLVSSVVLWGGLRLVIYLNRPASSDELRERVAVMPSLPLTTLVEEPYAPPAGRPVVLIYFNSTCDHCQREVAWLRKEQGRFDGVTVVLMSSQPLEELRVFSQEAGLDGTQFELVHIRHDIVAETFGALALPQAFVFDADRRLVGLFSGETDPLKIRSTLP